MSDIPSALNKIQIEGVQTRFPVSEDLLQTMGGSVNYLIDAFTNGLIKKTDFTASGSFTVPADVTILYIEGCGGGGGGGLSPMGNYSGGNGAVFKNGIITVTPSSVITVTIGAGGTGVVSADGGNGGNSSFGSLVVFPGAKGGKLGFHGSDFDPVIQGQKVEPYSYAYGGSYISGFNVGKPSGQNGFKGGLNAYSIGRAGGGGGAGPYGDGGNAQDNINPLTTAYGAGGQATNYPGDASANGIQGFIRLIYFSKI